MLRSTYQYMVIIPYQFAFVMNKKLSCFVIIVAVNMKKYSFIKINFKKLQKSTNKCLLFPENCVIITSQNTAQIKDLVCFGEHCYTNSTEEKWQATFNGIRQEFV